MRFLIFVLFIIVAGGPAQASIPSRRPASLAAQDQEAQNFFVKQCPGCSPVNLQYFINQQRFIKARTEAKDLTLKPGFYTIDQDEIPAKVKEASQSVYSLIVLDNDEGHYAEVELNGLKQTITRLQNSNLLHQRRVGLVLQIYARKCELQKESICRAPLGKGVLDGGSGVLMGESGKELWTAGHVFENALKAAAKNTGVNNVQELARRRMDFKVLVFNYRSELIADPYSNPLKLTYSASRQIIERLNPLIEIDNLRFEFEKPIGRGLQIATEIRPGEDTYSVGYPSCTGCAQVYNSPQEFLMSGTRFPHRDATQFDHQFTLGQVLEAEANVITTNADAQGGMSGGATFDSEGRVIGLNSAVNAQISSPSFLADRRLKLSRPAQWAAATVRYTSHFSSLENGTKYVPN